MSRLAGSNVEVAINNIQQQNFNRFTNAPPKPKRTVRTTRNGRVNKKHTDIDLGINTMDVASDLSENGSLLEGFESDVAGKTASSITLRGAPLSDEKEPGKEEPVLKSWLSKQLRKDTTPIKKRKHNVGFEESRDLPKPSTSNFLNSYADEPKALNLNTALAHGKLWDTPHAAAQFPKCSTESTSEFPLSSPSDIPVDCERMPVRRVPLLKNTLPADSFERGLSAIAQNSRWSIEEKIESWQCNSELSDVEDVNDFDEVFRQYEEQRKNEMKMKMRCNDNQTAVDPVTQHKTVFKDLRRQIGTPPTTPKTTKDNGLCDFSQFRIRMIKQLYSPPLPNWRHSGDNSTHTNADKPKATTASQFATQRQLLAAAEAETKARKQQKIERAQHSTTPPATSSTGSEENYYANVGHKRLSTHMRSNEKAGQYSTTSDDGTQDMAKRNRTDEEPTTSGMAMRSRQAQQRLDLPPKPSKRNTCVTPETSQDSVAPTVPALSPPQHSPLTPQETHANISSTNMLRPQSTPGGLIKMRLDFVEEKKNLQLKKKATAIFKTPSTPVDTTSVQPQPQYQPLQELTVTSQVQPQGSHENIQPVSPTKLTPLTISDASSLEPSEKPKEVAETAPRSDGSEFHQQHEFCNYLGLTGMSTVNAFASAVADLANCNLTRRSLRVRRLQQQEKQDKEKISRQSEGQTVIKADDRQQGGRDSAPPMLCHENSTDASSTPRTTPSVITVTGDNAEPDKATTSVEEKDACLETSERLMEPEKTPLSASKFIKSLLKEKKKEPEIKIVCKIDSMNKSTVKQKPNITERPIQDLTASNGPEIKIVCKIDSTNKSLVEQKSNITEKPIEDLSRRFKPNGPTVQRVEVAPPPALTAMPETSLKNTTPTKDVSTSTVVEKKTSSVATNNRVGGALKAVETPSSNQLNQKNTSPSISYSRELHHVKNKFQKFLQDSRRTKPSIYIVQSLGSIHATVQPPQPKDPTKPSEPPGTTPRKTIVEPQPKTPTKSPAIPPPSTSVKTAPHLSPKISVISSHSMGKNQTDTCSPIGGKLPLPKQSLSPQKQQRPSRSVSPPKKKTKSQRNTRQRPETPVLIDDNVLHGPANIDLDIAQNGKARRRGGTSRKAAVSGTKKKIRLRKITRNPLLPAKRQLRSARKTTIFVTNLKCMLKRKTKNSSTVKKVDKSIGTSDTALAPFKFDVLYGTQEISSYVADGKTNNDDSKRVIKPNVPVSTAPEPLSTTQPPTEPVEQAKYCKVPVLKQIIDPTKNLRNKRTARLRVSKDSSETVTAETVTKAGSPVPQTPPVKNHPLTKPEPVIKTNPNTNINKATNRIATTTTNNNNIKSIHNDAVTLTPEELMKGVHLKTLGCSTVAGRELRSKLIRQAGGGSSCGGGSCDSKTTERAHRSSRVYGSQRSQADSVAKRPPKVETKDIGVQALNLYRSDTIHYLTRPMRPWQNPLKRDYGRVLYIYFEMEVLIVVQEFVVSFWRYSKFLNVISMSPPIMGHKYPPPVTESRESINEFTNEAFGGYGESNEWIFLGESKRLCLDKEISTPYNNRICVNNSIPVYVEMRCREVPRDHRECTLLSMYINVYYFHDDEMTAKMHSIQLDAVQSAPLNVIYTTIPESRYFIMAWPQENILGKIRSGLCKYSLTPQMDTLASIREFKSLRHELLYLECTGDDKLIGFGATQLTIWDHRSGDVLMNYDLEMKLGRNLGSVYYPGMEIGQNSMIVLYQHIQRNTIDNYYHELVIIGCNVSHSQPTHRVLQRHKLPMPQFSRIQNATVTAEHLVLVSHNDEEIWLSTGNPTVLTCVPAQQTTRFYMRGRSQVIELTDKALTVDSVANHVLKLAALGMGVSAASKSYGGKS